jgi:hypothetical protein
MNNYQLAILRALQGRNIYYGTVSDAEIQRRRKANKAARVQRRNNRRLDTTR